MHSHSHHTEQNQDSKNLRLAFVLNLCFTIIELIGGIFTNSLAILSDALHDLGDSISLGLAWYFQKVSKRKSNKNYTYGYRRFSLLGAIINSVILIVGSVFILVKAIPRIIEPEVSDPKGMIVLAILGIIVNGFAVLRLKKGSSMNEKVVSLHLLEDVLGWVAVLIGAIIIHFTSWYQIDPILSIAISIYVLYNVYKNIKGTIKIILQATPEGVDLENIGKIILSVNRIKDYHNLHIWSLDGERNILTVHLVLEDRNPGQSAQIKTEVKELMKAQNIVHCTLELEYEDEECTD